MILKTKKIKLKDLKVGMKIKSYENGEITFKEVTHKWNTTVNQDQQVKLTFTNGAVVNCSANHPIMVLEHGKVIQKKPTDLTEFDEIISETQTVYLYSIDVGQDNDENYIDITVDGSNVFFAANNLTSPMILTHNSQGGVRNGSATLYYPIWHYEVEDMLVLKNNRGIEDNRVRHLDYGVQFNKLMYERLRDDGDITLFSPSDVPGLYDAFFADQDKFKELYERAERNTRLRKKTIRAVELFSHFMNERKDTGRIYLMNVDNANSHGSFKPEIAPIKQSNLCGEINLNTRPLNDLNDEDGRIALCTLSAINWGNVRKPQDFEKMCTLAIRGLDSLLSYQDYPVKAAKNSAMGHRPLGVGIINLAYWMAKNDMTYSEPNLDLIDQYAEAWSYYLIKASADLAKESGPCLWNDETKYSEGILPIDTYKKDVDELVTPTERMPWDELRVQLKETGIRNSTVAALMPSESSSQISNATNGIEPPRSLVSVKQSKHGVLRQVVPGIHRLKNKYELLWDQKSPEGYLKIMAVLQKYIDQGISVNTSYNPIYFEDEKIPMSVLLKDLLMFYKYGGKQLYYFNTMDGAGELDVDQLAGQSSDDEACDSCTI